jgi:hypothetical protein
MLYCRGNHHKILNNIIFNYFIGDSLDNLQLSQRNRRHGTWVVPFASRIHWRTQTVGVSLDDGWYGCEQFPSLLEYTDRHKMSVFPSVMWMWKVPFASGIQWWTQVVGVSLGDVHSVWQIVYVLHVYPPCKHLNWKLATQHNNNNIHNNYKINIYWYKISSIILHYKKFLYTFVLW